MRKAFSLPDDQCERLKRSEMNGVRMLLAHLSTAAYCRDDLKNRLEWIPDGNQRFMKAVDDLQGVCDDVVGTISRNQAKQPLGTLRDYELRLVPKATPGTVNVMMTKEIGMELMDLARERCLSCTEDGKSCLKCRLYKILEATTPMEDYGSGLICPYALAEWE